jgi:predicted nucleic acid-binding protein
MTTILRSKQLVIDASVGYRLFTYHAGRAMLDAMIHEQLAAGCRLVAPTLWQYEVTSILTKAVYARQLTSIQAEESLALVRAFPLKLVSPKYELTRAAFAWTVKLQRVVAYDSFYLALAQQMQCELWTYDRRLANAVHEPWVRYLEGAG